MHTSKKFLSCALSVVLTFSLMGAPVSAWAADNATTNTQAAASDATDSASDAADGSSTPATDQPAANSSDQATPGASATQPAEAAGQEDQASAADEAAQPEEAATDNTANEASANTAANSSSAKDITALATGTTVYNGVDYAAVYDCEYYLSKNADLRAAFGTDDAAAISHFVNYGMNEGRVASATFDIVSYYNANADLRAAFGTARGWKPYYDHYISYGKNEKRTCTNTPQLTSYLSRSSDGTDWSAVYDGAYYLSKSADLKTAFTKTVGSKTIFDDQALVNHFATYGTAEGRAASAAFVLDCYRWNYTDMRTAFGSDNAAYYRHYLNYGKNEKRVADRYLKDKSSLEIDPLINLTDGIVEMDANGGFLSLGVSSVRFAVWSEKGGQDDLVWYEATPGTDGIWRATVDLSKHNTTGTYQVHVYAVPTGLSNLTMVGASTFDIASIPNLSAANTSTLASGLTFTATSGSKTVSLTSQMANNIEYFFVPSGVDTTAITPTFTADEGTSVTLSAVDGTESVSIASGQAVNLKPLLKHQSNRVSYLKMTATDGTSTEETMFAVAESSSLSTLFLTSDDPVNKGRAYIEGSADHSTKATGSIALYDSSFSLQYSGALSQIKGRGNTSWSLADKKGYQIKLSKKQDLLDPESGTQKAKTWLLIASAFDPTQVRNAIFQTLALELGLGATPEYRYIDLYYDGEYRGCYLLCEKVEVNENRVDINDLESDIEDANPSVSDFDTLATATGKNSAGLDMQWVEGINDPANISGGYLIELDNAYYKSEKTWFNTSENWHFVVKSPEYLSKNACNYISCFVQEAIECVANGGVNKYTGKGLFDYFDKETLVKYFFTQEWTKNSDAFVSSTYFYKPANEDKLYAGPVWDADTSLGLSNEAAKFQQTYGWNGHFMANYLINIPAFQTALKEEYQKSIKSTVSASILNVTADTSYLRLLRTISASTTLNEIIWDYPKRNGGITLYPTYWQNVDVMVKFMLERNTWVDSTILSFSSTAASATEGAGYGAVYNYSYYVAKNPDVKAAYNGDQAAILQHFIQFGMSEGRSSCATFNVNVYRANNADLNAAFGDDLKQYYLHYIQYGKAEGRKAV